MTRKMEVRPEEPCGEVHFMRDRRLISRSMAWRMKARRSSSGSLSASIRANVPSAKDINHFSGNRSVLPKKISVSRIRYVDSPKAISHILFQDNGREEMPIWKQEPQLMEALRDIQNHPRFADQDIMSFAGMCTSARELAFHVHRCERLAYPAEWGE